VFFDDAVFFDQVGNHMRLPATDPVSECGQEELQMDRASHAASVSDDPQIVTPQHV